MPVLPDPQQQFADTLMTACQDTTIVETLGLGRVTCEAVETEEKIYKPTVPVRLQFETEIIPQHEGVKFSVQPKLRAFDSAVCNILRSYMIDLYVIKKHCDLQETPHSVIGFE